MRLFKTEIRILQSIAEDGCYFSDTGHFDRESRALKRLMVLKIIKRRSFDRNVEIPFHCHTFR